jgi:hypothetical protein
MRPRNFLIALPLAALALAGCGGGGSSSTASTPSVTTTPTTASLSKAEYVKQGDAICAEVNAAVGATGSTSSSGSSTPVGQVADIYTGMVNSLTGLGTPEGGGNSEFITAAEDLSTAESEAKLADERGDSSALSAAETSATSAIVSFQSAAQAFGFKECGEGPSAPSTSPGTTTPSSSSTTPGTTTTPTTVAPEPESAPVPNTGGAGGTAETAPEAPATGGGTAGDGTGGGGGSSSGGIGPG